MKDGNNRGYFSPEPASALTAPEPSQARILRYKFLMELASTYIILPLDQVGETVQRTLGQLGDFVGADRACLFETDASRGLCTCTHEWCREGVSSQKSKLTNVSLDGFPCWRDYYRSGRPLYVPDRSVLPQADPCRGILRNLEIRSLIGVPLMDEGNCVGFIRFEAVRGTREFHTDEEDLLSAFAHMLVHLRRRRASEELLLRTKQTYQDIFNSLTEAVYVQDAQGVFIDVNQGAEVMYGCTRADLIGKTPLDVAAPGLNDVAAIWEAECEVLRTGQPAHFDFWAVRKNGEIFPKEVVVHKGRYFGQDVLIATARDVTEKKRDEQERIKLYDQLQHARKMESIGRLAGGIAHDFNNMLGAILGNIELAMEHVHAGTVLHQELKEVQRAAEHSADITRQLLTFARKQTVAPKRLDVNKTVEGMLTMLRRLIGENIECRWLPGSPVGPVCMDPAQMDQVLANLCINARDAISNTGQVYISTEDVVITEEDAKLQEDAVPGRFICLTVRDTGCGMDPETLAHVFEPFFTTKEIGKGTGLGLSTVYGIVRQNGGFIDVSSQPGVGSTFRVHLPRHEGGSVSAAEQEAAAPTAGTGGQTILLVEDEPAILKLAETLLTRKGYHVLATTHPEEALGIARTCQGDIHLLLTDVVMPGMNGHDLAAALSQSHPRVRLLFMSGYTADLVADHGVLDPGVHFIQKPFTLDALAKAVTQALTA